MLLPRKWVFSLGLLAAVPGITVAGPLDFLKPKTGEESAATATQSNQDIAEAVAGALKEARLQGKDIEIEVKGGVCTLKGQIADVQQRGAATQIVASVPGVEAVDNQMTLRQAAGAPEQFQRPQTVQQAGFDGSPRGMIQQVNHQAAADNQQVAQRIANAVGSAGLSGYDVEIRYKAGVASLIGDVGSQQEAMRAEQAARSVAGVNDVLNRLTVNGRPIAQQAGMPQQAMPAGYPTMMPQGGTPAMMASQGQMAGAPAQTAGHLLHNQPNVPSYAWPSYAYYDNYAQVTYPQAYDASAWPYIGPFYPYPQVPMEWRSAELEWDDGYWQLNFNSRTDRWWWFLNPHNWH